MKKIIFIFLILAIAACKKDSQGPAPGDKIFRVTVDGKISVSFEYDEKNRLVKESNYGFCTSNPQDEFFYSYKDNRLSKINSVIRGLYSSLAALCDPSSGLRTEEIFSYDNAGRISKVTRENSVSEYIYNRRGFLEKKIIVGTIRSLEYVYVHDFKGNVIKEIDPEGNITEYEYDAAPNPFYLHKPGVTTPFSMSPNNIIAGKGRVKFVRKFKYNRNNIPVEVLEDNGLTYIYHYK